jgi:hypothetical protein
LARRSSGGLDPDGGLDGLEGTALLVLPPDAAVGGADIYKTPWHGHATTEDEMGQVRLANAGEDVCFVVIVYQPGTFMGGTLLDKENLALAVSLLPEASVSEPALVEIPAELHRRQRDRLLATGFPTRRSPRSEK